MFKNPQATRFRGFFIVYLNSTKFISASDSLGDIAVKYPSQYHSRCHKIAKNLYKDATYKAANPKENDYTINDGEGLVMLVKSTGVKRWRSYYRINGKQNRLGFGVYPGVTLEAARGKAGAARTEIAKGIDPAEAKKQSRLKGWRFLSLVTYPLKISNQPTCWRHLGR